MAVTRKRRGTGSGLDPGRQKAAKPDPVPNKGPLPMTSTPTTSLAAIITAARAGSIGYASTLFEAGGWAARDQDPAALATRARLLKDAALRAGAEERQHLLIAAAQAYGRADSVRPQPYTQINQASLHFLAGDHDRARSIARPIWPKHPISSPRRAQRRICCAGILPPPHRRCATRLPPMPMAGRIAPLPCDSLR